VIHIGNGEIFERACLALGEGLAGSLWSYSERNLQIAKSHLQSEPLSVVWHVSSDPQKAQARRSAEKKIYYRWDDSGRLEESGLFFSPRELIENVQKKHGLAATPLAPESAPTLAGVMEYEIQGVRAPLVLVLDDEVLLRVERSLSEEIIPVTLSLFEAKASAAAEKGYHLFNGGIDFALNHAGELFMGSLRNLFADKAVGFLDQADPVSQQNLEKFFAGRNWIGKDILRPSLKYVSLSCDGLPVVGPVRSAGGIFYASGFSGRTANFIFAVLTDLLSDLVEGKGSRLPEFMSNRRYV
jgi:hypothetical protein